MDRFQQAMTAVQNILWSVPMLLALIGIHLYFTFKLDFVQKKVFQGIKLSISKKGQDGRKLSSFSALATSLAATIGTGNIIGISTAIAIGGAGAVFWCWVSGILGMATCYAECFLSAKYKVRNADGSCSGGPMYVMDRVLHQKNAAAVFALASILVSFGMGSSVQSHSLAAAAANEFSIKPQTAGIISAILVGMVILGGAKKIKSFCSWFVPVMSVFYMCGCLLILWINRSVLLQTVETIVREAFGIRSILGGVAGGTFLTGMRIGISRGLFTNEAGLGSIPMAASTVADVEPNEQALISMTGPFWDTVIMCAVTGLVIVSTMIKSPEIFVGAEGDRLSFLAFSVLPFDGEGMLAVSLILFAFATILGWNFFGTCAVRYLFGEAGIIFYQVLYILAVYMGTVLSLNMVWTLSDIANALMMIPNLLCLLCLRREIYKKK